MSVQWFVSSDGGKTYQAIPGTASSTPTSGDLAYSALASSTLTLSDVQALQSGDLYEATFTNYGGSTTTSAAKLTVTPPPKANAQTVSVAHGSKGDSFTLSGSDPNLTSPGFTFAIAGQTGGGTITLNDAKTGAVTYVPAANFQGKDTFTFTVTDADGTSDPATVTLNVAAGTPAAAAQTVPVAHDSTGTAFKLSGTDPDSPALSLTYAIGAGPSHGKLSGTVPNLTYTPSTGYQGSDSFTFTASNGTNPSSPATVTLNVAAGTPTANAQTVPVSHDSPGMAITLTSTDDNAPALAETYSFSQPSHGTVAVSGPAGSPTVIYTPAAGYHGTDSFTFTASNGTNASGSATVTLNVATGTPTAAPQSVGVAEGSTAGITLGGSDGDNPALTLTYAVATQPSHGTLSGTAPNLTYTPNAGYVGPDSFTFTANNGTNTSGSAKVSLTVNPPSVAAVSGTVGVSWGTSGAATLQTNADGLRLLPSGRNTDLPWSGINRLSITLSQPETLSASDVAVTGINVASYGAVTLSGSGTSYTITLGQPISAADRVTITIGNASISTFTRRLDVLPGDVNDDGLVNAQDTTIEHNAMLGQYHPRPDLLRHRRQRRDRPHRLLAREGAGQHQAAAPQLVTDHPRELAHDLANPSRPSGPRPAVGRGVPRRPDHLDRPDDHLDGARVHRLLRREPRQQHRRDGRRHRRRRRAGGWTRPHQSAESELIAR